MGSQNVQVHKQYAGSQIQKRIAERQLFGLHCLYRFLSLAFYALRQRLQTGRRSEQPNIALPSLQ